VTVRRDFEVSLEATPSEVRAALDSVVRSSARWKLLGTELQGVRLQHRPGWYAGQLPTHVEAHVIPSNTPGCGLHLKSTSQRLIYGDIFGIYERLLRRLASEVKQELAR
jgi:hypothetical protein